MEALPVDCNNALLALLYQKEKHKDSSLNKKGAQMSALAIL